MKFTQLTLREQFNKNHQKTIKRLNNIFISADMIIPILKTAREETRSKPDKVINFTVPSTSSKSKKKRVIPRKKEDFISFLDETISFDLYKYMIISIVSLVEDYLASTTRILLKKYPKKLTARVQGNQTVTINKILDANDLEEIVDSLISERIISIFYGSPSKQFEYFSQVLQLTLESDIVLKYIEIKATRDLLVHSDGIVNDVYLSKVEGMQRADLRERIPLSDDYFDHVIRTCKKLIGIVRRDCLKVYCSNDEEGTGNS
ncbi:MULTISPECIES: hypothetical protein [Paenibacillus]|uniref:hypothetical protein n=1 Tax=Paenibacillus TaxID=44249 RepID=UPI002024CBA5|nr:MULTISPECIES: hypothetical protein [Paenibacillus]URJ44476.1 hypothetical protein MF628_004202 [Paenibacillus polymyxa]